MSWNLAPDTHYFTLIYFQKIITLRKEAQHFLYLQAYKKQIKRIVYWINALFILRLTAAR